MNVSFADPQLNISSQEANTWACPIIIKEDYGVKRVNEPVTLGIPLACGMVSDPLDLGLIDENGTRIVFQTEILARWVDGSIQWVLVDFFANVDSHTSVVYQLIPGDFSHQQQSVPCLTVTRREDQLVVDTGVVQFNLDTQVLKPFDAVLVDDCPGIQSEGTSLTLVDQQGKVYHPIIEQLTVETEGPVRTTVRIEGLFSDQQVSLGKFDARFSFYAGSGLVAFTFTLHNPKAARHPGGLWDLGDEGSMYFEDLSFCVPFRSTAIAWNTHPLESVRTQSEKPLEIYQDSSGGSNWKSHNHVNGQGDVKHQFSGYRVMSDGIIIEDGKRSTPTVGLTDQTTCLLATVEHFWQNFPKALEANQGQLMIRLFPHQYDDVYEMQGGEQKTHTMYLEFSKAGNSSQSFDWVHNRLLPQSSPEWYCQSKAVNYLTPRSQDQNREFLECIDMAIEGDHSFFNRREIIDEYGWRNFGEFYADHEAVGTGEDCPPRVSHYNNQYDSVCGGMIEYMRTGDARWFELGRDLARHVVDIDIYHTMEDRVLYNGGMFWHTDHYYDAATGTHRAYSKASLTTDNQAFYGGGPSNEQNYTSGLLQYYFLTGDPLARQAVLSLADWVIRMDEGEGGVLKYVDRRPSGWASATVNHEYHGPGRGAGNSINALLDGFRLTGDQSYLLQSEVLIRRCIHPFDDISVHNLEDIEYRWSYLVFLQVLGKYLDLKIELGTIDYMYAYARASLLHYAEWMGDHEVPYCQVLDRVQIPTETWPAQDIRKSNVFKFAAKYTSHQNKNLYLQKANEFFHASVSDLNAFETCRLTRPIVLLLVNGYLHSYFQLHGEESAPIPQEKFDFGTPKRFVPQFYEIKKLRSWLRDGLSRFRG